MEMMNNYLQEDDNVDDILRKIRTLHSRWPANAWRGEQVAKLFKALDEWLSNGGPPPEAWDWNPLYKSEQVRREIAYDNRGQVVEGSGIAIEPKDIK